MAETLLQYQKPVPAPNGKTYEARACGGPMTGGTWEGWIEFVPVDGGPPVRSPRETTQPNRPNAEYWATGLTPVYLEGALTRALEPLIAVPVSPPPPQPSMFTGPAPRLAPVESPGYESVLDPFSVYEKGELVLRRQLAALPEWHLGNIVRADELSAEDAPTLARRPAADLIEIIVSGVRAERGGLRQR